MLVYRTWEVKRKHFIWSNHQTWSAIKNKFKYNSEYHWQTFQCSGLFLFGIIPLFVKESRD